MGHVNNEEPAGLLLEGVTATALGFEGAASGAGSDNSPSKLTALRVGFFRLPFSIVALDMAADFSSSGGADVDCDRDAL